MWQTPCILTGLGRNDRNVMVNFEPGECMRRMFFQLVTQVARKSTPKRSWVYDNVVTSLDAFISTHLIHNNRCEEVMICLNNKDRFTFFFKVIQEQWWCKSHTNIWLCFIRHGWLLLIAALVNTCKQSEFHWHYQMAAYLIKESCMSEMWVRHNNHSSTQSIHRKGSTYLSPSRDLPLRRGGDLL